VPEVFRTGARSSWIDHAQKGRHQYSEIAAVLRSVRTATAIRRQMDATVSRAELVQLALATPIREVHGLLRLLEERGHWHGVLRSVVQETSADVVPLAALPSRIKQPRPKPTKTTPDLAALPGLVTAAMTPNAEGAEAFQSAVAALAAGATGAVTARDPRLLVELSRYLEPLITADAQLREAGTHLWPALLDLSLARFRMVWLAIETGEKDTGYALLTDITKWTKQVLGQAVVEEDRDFDTAIQFVLSGHIAYYIAHCYLVPEAMHLSDRSIEIDLQRSMRRVFADEALSARVIEVFGLNPLPPL
jgi:hypothetical protein